MSIKHPSPARQYAQAHRGVSRAENLGRMTALSREHPVNNKNDIRRKHPLVGTLIQPGDAEIAVAIKGLCVLAACPIGLAIAEHVELGIVVAGIADVVPGSFRAEPHAANKRLEPDIGV